MTTNPSTFDDAAETVRFTGTVEVGDLQVMGNAEMLGSLTLAGGTVPGVVVTSYGTVGDGSADDTAAFAAAIAAAKAINADVLVPGGVYKIDAGGLDLSGVAIHGIGCPNLQPSNGAPPYEYLDGMSVFSLTSVTTHPFYLGTGGAIYGCAFWHPDQVTGTTVAFPAVFGTNATGTAAMNRNTIANCVFFNSYRVFDPAAGAIFGDVQFYNNRVWAIKSLLRLRGYMPEYFRCYGNFFSYGVAGSLAATTATDQLNEYVTNGKLIELDNGAASTPSMDGLLFNDNFVFGVNTFFYATSGSLSISQIADNAFDGVASVLDWASTGSHVSISWQGNTIYSYKVGDTAAVQPVFKVRSAAATSEFSFRDNSINYCQAEPFDIQATIRRLMIAGNRIRNWGMTTTASPNVRRAVIVGSAITDTVIVNNDFLVANANGSVAARGIQANAGATILGNNFDTVYFPVEVVTGVSTVKGNKSRATPSSTSISLTGAGTAIGHNEDNAWDKPLAGTGQTVILPDATNDAASTIAAGVKSVVIAAITTNADDWLVLPVISTVGVGWRIKGWSVVAHEIRTPASSNVTINDVDADGTKEIAIPATTYWEAEAITATGWLLRAWDELAAPITALVPHS